MKTQNSRLVILAGLAGIFLSAGVTRAVSLITPTSARRAVSANASFTTPLATNATAVGFTPFDRAVHLGFSSRYEPWSLDASQQSYITNSSITATGMVSMGFANAFVSGRATNEFRVTFRLTSPANYTLAGSLVWDGAYGAGLSFAPVVRLTGPGGVVYAPPAVPNDATPVDLNASGLLPAGIYALEAYAGVVSDFAGGETMNYDLSFQATPAAPPVFNTQVYQLNASLTGVTDIGAPVVRLNANHLVNLALNLPATNAPKNQFLALVTDALDHSARLAVWDKSVTNIIAELAPLNFNADLVDLTNYSAIATVPFLATGRMLDLYDGIASQLALFATGKTDASNNIIKFTGSGVLGQINTVNDAGATNLTLIRSGTLSLGRKLGALP